MDISYRQLYRMNQEEARRQIVTTYLDTGSISQVARLWQTSRNVVRKWVRRFEDEGEEGLKDRSKLLRQHARWQGFGTRLSNKTRFRYIDGLCCVGLQKGFPTGANKVASYSLVGLPSCLC